MSLPDSSGGPSGAPDSMARRPEAPSGGHWGPETQQSKPFPTTYVIAAVLIVAVVIAGLVVYFRKCKRQVELK